MTFENFTQTSAGCFIHNKHVEAFAELGLKSINDFMDFEGGEGINLAAIAKFRNRVVFQAGNEKSNFYLKTYNHPPLKVQLSNWFEHKKRASTAAYDYLPAMELAKIGINTPVVAAFGEVMGVFEKMSFIVTEEITEAVDLEKNVPPFFKLPLTREKFHSRRKFIDELAAFTSKFHNNGFCHRDYYLTHIFWGEGGFEMIDLQRVFKPHLLAWRYRLKDIAQLYYSAPGSVYTYSERLRFYKRYLGKDKLNAFDRWFIRQVKKKAQRIAAHDEKQGRVPPFKN